MTRPPGAGDDVSDLAGFNASEPRPDNGTRAVAVPKDCRFQVRFNEWGTWLEWLGTMAGSGEAAENRPQYACIVTRTHVDCDFRMAKPPRVHMVSSRAAGIREGSGL